MIPVLVIDPDPVTRAATESMLRAISDFDVTLASNGDEGRRLTETFAPHVVIIEPDLPDSDGVALLQTLHEHFPASGVIVLTRQDDDTAWRRAMQHGARYFLKKSDASQRLIDAVRDVDAQTAPLRVIEPPHTYLKHLILVCSARDGTGSTTLAINLAYGLSQHNPHTLLIDADLPFGDAGTMLGVHPYKSLLDLIHHRHHLDKTLLETLVERADVGMRMISAPAKLPDALALARQSPDILAETIQLAADWCDFCIVDTGNHLDYLSALAASAAKIVLTMTPDRVSMKNTHTLLNWLTTESAITRSQLCMVLNKASDNWYDALPAHLVEEYLNLPLRGIIPRVNPHSIHNTYNMSYPLLALKNSKSPEYTYPHDELNALVDHVYYSLSGAGSEN